MTSIRILAPALLACAFVSCASQKADQYDTPNAAGAAQASAPATESANPVYDTPAAYEETGTAAVADGSGVNIPASPAPEVSAPAAPPAPSNGAAIIHTVVAGDTLSGISAKYKVPSAAIRQANNMTKDTVILGRKMVIPPVR
ncbi:LysM peptidoglycan-binding domain-containing protein [Luteolibacter yonseiensis]|uniref:LysM peptidoglycan-binding domain-containing protein n=1 Tax=Luteolibacter yonseiensis TaxID=1144680 RepID=A0A934R520_9BACT|nr:LysM peptidoglycan-binding domain-containing protein [Luteolibacter yonseiensis]MBK1815395.1 LysM peptidoglycan-binding domain-containing protein [Luteolibacter yonseiensis]